MTSLRLLALSALALAPLAAPAVASEVGQTYSGAACQALTSSSPIVRDAFGKVRNAGTTSQTVVCPVAQQDTAHLRSMEFGEVDATRDVTCLARAGTNTGLVVASASPNNIVPLSGGTFFGY